MHRARFPAISFRPSFCAGTDQPVLDLHLLVNLGAAATQAGATGYFRFNGVMSVVEITTYRWLNRGTIIFSTVNCQKTKSYPHQGLSDRTPRCRQPGPIRRSHPRASLARLIRILHLHQLVWKPPRACRMATPSHLAPHTATPCAPAPASPSSSRIDRGGHDRTLRRCCRIRRRAGRNAAARSHRLHMSLPPVPMRTGRTIQYSAPICDSITDRRELLMPAFAGMNNHNGILRYSRCFRPLPPWSRSRSIRRRVSSVILGRRAASAWMNFRFRPISSSFTRCRRRDVVLVGIDRVRKRLERSRAGHATA